MLMKYLYVTIAFSFILNVAFGQQSVTATMQQQHTFENVCYKVTDDGDSILLDIFLPKSVNIGKHFPVLMVIHGGAWVKGDKNLEEYYYTKQLKEASLKNGFAIVSLNYRLVDSIIHFPAPIQDCKDAVRWVRANSATYGFDTANIGLWGASAGAHLALLVGDTPDSLWTGSLGLANYSCKVNYIIDNFGPTDLNKLFKTNASGFTVFLFKTFLKQLYVIRNRLIQGITTYDYLEHRQLARESLLQYSPIAYIHSNVVPSTLIFQGTRDKVVPFNQSKVLYRLLKNKGTEVKFVKINKGNHGFFNIPKEQIDALVTKNIAFMKSHWMQH